jgi:hypothetical protein
MVSKPVTTQAKRLNFAKKVVTNGQKVPEIKTAMAEYNYTTAKYTHAKTLIATVEEGLSERSIERGGQKGATVDEHIAQQEASAAYQGVAQLANKRLTPAQRTELGLPARQPRKTATFITTAYTVLDNLATTGLLADYGYTADKIAAERAKIEAYEQADQAQAEAKGAKEQGTKDQEAAFAELDAWVTAYVTIAKTALRKQPQLLEKLGIKVRSSKTKAQRAAPKKAAATRAAKKAK